MSCNTLNRQAIQLGVAAASLPEGFCPATFQELFNAMAERLIISPSTTFNTFAIGSTAPASNVGPWLKDCTSWFVFNDVTASYVPTNKGGFDNQQYITASTTFVVPDFIYKLKIEAFGAGGGGCAWNAASVFGGGGGGAYGCSIVAVTPGQSIPIVIGAAGAGGAGSGGASGAAGGSTTILGGTAGGGGGSTSTVSGAGGTATGFQINLNGQYGQFNATGSAAVSEAEGGDAAGWGGKGGASTGNASHVGRNGTAPGGGGCGGINGADFTSGNGADGAVLIQW